jgi:hypothetical protein
MKMLLKFKNRKDPCKVFLFVLLLGVAGMTNGYAQGNVSVGNFAMHLDGDTHLAIVISCDVNFSCSGSLTIPSTVYYENDGHMDSYTVVGIANYAFDGCTNFTSLSLPGTLLSIGTGAFAGCTGFMGELVIPNSVTTIGSGAFNNCTGFTGTLTVPPLVTTIQSNAFGGCTGFSNLVLPENLTTIESDAFQNCTGFTGILNIPNTVTTIGAHAFENCTGFTGTLNLPTDLTTLGDLAFQGCSGISSVVVPASLTSMGIHVFRYCDGLTAVYYNAGNCANCNGYYPPFRDLTAALFIGEGVERIPNYMFSIADFTGNLVLPSTLMSIGNHAFDYCDGFTGNLIIPNPVTEIGQQAFDGCTGFNGTLTFGNALTTIGDRAFQGCTGFTGDLIMGSSVTTIEQQAFYGCTGFSGNLTIGNSVTTIGYNAFYGCTGFTGILTVGTAVTSIGSGAFNPASNAINFSEVHYNAVNCGDCSGSPFNRCSGTLIIDENVERIPAKMFSGACLTGELVIPDAVTTIGNNAFSNCSSFTGNLVIPNAVTTIGNNAFSGCTGFTGTLTLGSSVTTIGNSAFSGCNGFTGNLTIPNSVTTIGNSAFKNCKYFTGNLIIPNSVTMIGSEAFYGCTRFSGDLIIPNSVTTLGSGAFYQCQGFNGNLTLSDALTTIENYTFYSCTGFAGRLTIGSAVETIGISAFYNCWRFASIDILPITPPTLVSNPFYYATTLYTVPARIPCGTLGAYQAADGWSNFTNYQEVCDTFEVTVEVVGGGTVSGAGTYNFGQTCTLVPTPNPGYVFDHWVHSTGELIPDNPYVFAVTANVNVEAFFVPGSVSHEYVDLGLPSGTLWATCNVGAATPESYGDYFAWGETTPKNTYNGSTYQYYAGSNLTKYTGSDGLTTLLPEDDAATANWGSDWRMPTEEEWNELLNNTTCTWTTQNDVNGRLFTASNGNSLFLPAAGYRLNSNLYTAGGYGYYWSSSLLMDNPDYARALYFDPDNYYMDISGRDRGLSVRAVRASSVPGETTQTINLSQGWNWYSTYIEQGGIDGLAQLEGSLGANGIQIKSQEQYLNYYEGMGWMGTLSGINNESSYKIKANAPCVLEMAGTETTSAAHPITVGPGWNWIGYPVNASMSVTTAMSGIMPANGDQLKAQNGYANYYDGIGWMGTLTTIEPGTGLLYKSNNSQTLTLVYPDPEGAKGAELAENVTAADNHWVLDMHAYPDNMTVTAVVELDDVELTSDSYELAAFANGECRGSVRLMYIEPIDRHIAFLIVAGEEVTTLSFSLYDTTTGKEIHGADEQINFSNNATLGDLMEPYVIRFRSTTGTSDWARKLHVFPNPVARGENVSLGQTEYETGEMQIEIINALGVVVETLRATSVQTITAPDVAGVYTLRITVEGKGTCYRKLVVR